MSQVLYSAGYHGEGRLARRGTESRLTKIQTRLPPLLMFACGWKHNVFLTRDRQVYVCGDVGDGQLGPNAEFSATPVYSLALSELMPVWVACGDKITALLTEDGKVYACGTGWGPGPVPLIAPNDVVFICCGVTTICGIGADGEFFIWENHEQVAVHIKSPAQFYDCAAGKAQFFALSTTGVLYVTGKSKSCGQGRKWSSRQLVKVPGLSGYVIKRIFAYCGHSIAIDEEGKVFACGANAYGQLGLGDIRKTNKFERVTTFDDHPVMYASLGDTFSAFVTEQLELYTCGDGDEYRLCNDTCTKVSVASPAKAAIGKSVMWMSCGCSHVIIAENLQEIPSHPGRLHFGLDGTTRRKNNRLPSKLVSAEIDGLAKPIMMDVSDYGCVWTGYEVGDLVSTEDGKKGVVLGAASRGLVVRIDNENRIFEMKDLKWLYETLEVEKRAGAKFKTELSRGGFKLSLDITDSACRVFGFGYDDRVEHPLLGKGSVAGTFGGNLWFRFDDDSQRIVTTLVAEPEYLHKWLTIIEPRNRKIEYMEINGTKSPIEVDPCDVLAEFDISVGDLVETAESIGIIIGSFRHMALIEDVLTKKMDFVQPTSLTLLRHFGTKKVCVAKRTLSNKGVLVDVSCNKTDKFMPFDRVLAPHGTATIIGKGDDNSIWCAYEDTVAIGAGIGKISGESTLKLIRRIGYPGVNEDGESVSSIDFSGLPVLPSDVIVLDGVKYLVAGMTKDRLIALCNASDGSKQCVSTESLANCSIVFRANLPATRIYLSSTGNGLTLSVSTRDFIGTRFLPDDVIDTPEGVGLVVGITDCNVAIHLADKIGVSFFTPQAIYDAEMFRLRERRAVVSPLNNSV